MENITKLNNTVKEWFTTIGQTVNKGRDTLLTDDADQLALALGCKRGLQIRQSPEDYALIYAQELHEVGAMNGDTVTAEICGYNKEFEPLIINPEGQIFGYVHGLGQCDYIDIEQVEDPRQKLQIVNAFNTGLLC